MAPTPASYPARRRVGNVQAAQQTASHARPTFAAALEIYAPDGFALWPVAEFEPHGFLPLSGAFGPAEVGTAVMHIADCNDIDPEADDRPPRPADPLGALLHGLLTMEDLFASGGLRVTDTATGTTLLEEWRDWLEVVDGDGRASFGHDPTPLGERLGEAVRLTVDAEQNDSPVIELPVAELRRLLAEAERDPAGFLKLAVEWAAQHLRNHAASVTASLARALDLPAPVALS